LKQATTATIQSDRIVNHSYGTMSLFHTPSS